MTIAVLSGKGGTGKTTVAASLASVLGDSQYIDCDVEEPNGFIFLNPAFTESVEVTVRVPEIDMDSCTLCGECARICQFNALAVAGPKMLVFPELCHHCGACLLACKPMAIIEVERPIGVIEADADCRIVQGKLHVGEPVGVPILAELKNWIDPDRVSILDCPPGSSCSVVQSLSGCDYAVLVTEPTPFGLHDLHIAVSLIRKMGIPGGVVVNKAWPDNTLIEDYCREADMPILLEIPFSRNIAERYAHGRLPVDGDPGWTEKFNDMYKKIAQVVPT